MQPAASPGGCLPPSPCLQSAPSDLAAYGVKERLLARWREVAGPSAAAAAAGSGAAGAAGAEQGAGAAGAGEGAAGDFVSAQQRALFALLSCYSDLLLPCRPYPTAAGRWGISGWQFGAGRGELQSLKLGRHVGEGGATAAALARSLPAFSSSCTALHQHQAVPRPQRPASACP